jgi:hypothetical protein
MHDLGLHLTVRVSVLYHVCGESDTNNIATMHNPCGRTSLDVSNIGRLHGFICFIVDAGIRR